MFKNKTVTIVLPAYNEDKTISNFINDLKSLDIYDEIIAVDNNSSDETKNEILKSSVTYINEVNQGFGAALKCGLDIVKTELILVCEPDGSFNAEDSLKLLEKSDYFDAVLTSRTNNKMSLYLKYGNIIYAKVVSLLFNGPKLNDVGSSLRLFRNEHYKIFKDTLKYQGPEFQLELTINLFKLNLNIIEIPVIYKKRVGKSNYTGNFNDSLKVAIKFTKVVIRKFLRFE